MSFRHGISNLWFGVALVLFCVSSVAPVHGQTNGGSDVLFDVDEGLRLFGDKDYYGGYRGARVFRMIEGRPFSRDRGGIAFERYSKELGERRHIMSMRFRTGNVGVGTANPRSQLEVSGKTILDETKFELDEGLLLYGDDSYYGGYRGARIFRMTEEDPYGKARGGIAFEGHGKENSETKHIMSLRFQGGGRVGIGTKSPQSKLAVEGTVTTREVVVTETGWADFVFEEDYDLPGLSEVEHFIGEHGHLPGMPSAEEVAENGLRLGEMEVRLLKQVEELVLHILQQRKWMQAQQKCLHSQQAQLDAARSDREALWNQVNALKSTLQEQGARAN